MSMKNEIEDNDNSMENTQTETYNMNVNDLEFIMTCGACPEQYDVFYDKKQVAYIRLRWGYLTVSCPDYGGTCIYESNAGANSWSGCFEDDIERMKHMKKIRQAIVDYYNDSEFS